MILDLFAGPGGWDEGAKALGLYPVGVEWDDAACRTAKAAGHARVRADVATLPTEPMVGKVTGLIASPPCQDFSSAGPKLGRAGSRGQFTDEVLRYATALRPQWVVCEQVPEALDVFKDIRDTLRSQGYDAIAGNLNAADYGVPQTRKRAILIASRVRPVAWPAPTHSPHPSMFDDLPAWITAREVLGWDGTLDRRQTGAPVVRLDRPFPTVTGAALGKVIWVLRDSDGTRRKVSVQEASVWQGFPPDYPWQGTTIERGLQLGDAVPPPLATHILSAVTGIPLGMRPAA